MVAPDLAIENNCVSFLGLDAHDDEQQTTARALLLYSIWKVHGMLRRQQGGTMHDVRSIARHLWAVLRKEFVDSQKAMRVRRWFRAPPRAPTAAPDGGDAPPWWGWWL